MVPIGRDYYYHEGSLYKKIKPQHTENRKEPRYYITTKQGKRKWITQSQLEQLAKHRHL